MNIAEAKEQIRRAMQAYFTLDEYGNFRIPPEAQRPLFLMGPPGIGKTAILKQVAEEMGVGLVSYSMTHHTRQSALGLPRIVHKCFEEQAYEVSEYTMSEIFSSVYDLMAESGVRRGILFLDEINCVSETLTPTMLQFLQFKTFGRHALPDGWIVVTAGNPPEYNRSAREFDIVTWDRLKRIDIDPDYQAWKSYALKRGTHASILTYLDVKKQNFYQVETHVAGKHFVTARGWSDLSDMIDLYEYHDLPVDLSLISQYIQNPEIAEDFAIYYDLYNKYKADYQIDTILTGTVSSEIYDRAKNAPFDERLTLLGLLLERVNTEARHVMETEDVITQLLTILREVKGGASLADKCNETEEHFQRDKRRGALSPSKHREYDRVLDFLHKHLDADFSQIKASYEQEVLKMRMAATAVNELLSHLFAFIEEVWPAGQELLLLVTELTVNCHTARYIGRYGCEAYYRHNQELLFYQRQTEIIKELEQLEMEI
ncbi:MAG: AAA family ATPase [Lachnospiraceae bacterium]|nr:AAA family ATPase [Lachnospiraceae bacterium]